MKTQEFLSFFVSTIVFTIMIMINPITAVGYPGPSTTTPSNGSDFIRMSCGTTLYPDLCYASLSRYSASVQKNPAQLARVAISVSLGRAKRAAAHFSELTRQADYGGDNRAAAALHDCFSNFGDAVEEIRGSLRQMRHLGNGGGESFRFQMSNVQTWMSAALTDQETCTDGFDGVEECPVKADVFVRATEVKQHTSNALALVNSFAEKSLP